MSDFKFWDSFVYFSFKTNRFCDLKFHQTHFYDWQNDGPKFPVDIKNSMEITEILGKYDFEEG